MKKIIIVGCLFLTGCVPLMIERDITVEKDANGNIIKTIETEKAQQQASTINTMQFKYLKDGNGKPIQNFDASTGVGYVPKK